MLNPLHRHRVLTPWARGLPLMFATSHGIMIFPMDMAMTWGFIFGQPPLKESAMSVDINLYVFI
jgi:hypothetical protein